MLLSSTIITFAKQNGAQIGEKIKWHKTRFFLSFWLSHFHNRTKYLCFLPSIKQSSNTVRDFLGFETFSRVIWCSSMRKDNRIDNKCKWKTKDKSTAIEHNHIANRIFRCSIFLSRQQWLCRSTKINIEWANERMKRLSIRFSFIDSYQSKQTSGNTFNHSVQVIDDVFAFLSCLQSTPFQSSKCLFEETIENYFHFRLRRWRLLVESGKRLNALWLIKLILFRSTESN